MLNPVLFSLLDDLSSKTETKEEQEQLKTEMEEGCLCLPVGVGMPLSSVMVGAGGMLAEKATTTSYPLVIVKIAVINLLS